MTESTLNSIVERLLNEEDDVDYKRTLACYKDNCSNDTLRFFCKAQYAHQLSIPTYIDNKTIIENIYNILSHIELRTILLNSDSSKAIIYLENIDETIKEWIDNDWSHQYAIYTMYSAGLIDYDKSIYKSTITDKGKDFIDIFDDHNFEVNLDIQGGGHYECKN